MVVASARSGLAVALGVLLFRRLSLLLLVIVAGPRPLLWLLCEGPVWLLLLPQLWSPLVVGFIVGGLVTPCASWPCVLLGVRSFRTRGRFAACLLLVGAPCFRSLFVLLRPSLSFSALPCYSPSSIWGLALSAALSVLLGPLALEFTPPYLLLLGACLCPSGSSGVGVQSSLSPAYAVGSSSSVYPWSPPSPFFRLCPGLWVVFLALYSTCLLVPVHQVFAVPCGFGVELPLSSIRTLHSASLRPLGCSIASCLLSRRCCLSSALVFSVPSPVGSSWAPLSRFSWRPGLPPLPV